MLTIEPPRRGRSERTATAVPYIGPRRRTRRPRSISSGVTSWAPPTMSMPALFTQPVSRPPAAAAAAARSWVDHSPMSPTSGSNRSPSSEAAASASPSQSTPTTWKPWRTSRLETALPMPIAAPVTTTDSMRSGDLVAGDGLLVELDAEPGPLRERNRSVHDLGLCLRQLLAEGRGEQVRVEHLDVGGILGRGLEVALCGGGDAGLPAVRDDEDALER